MSMRCFNRVDDSPSSGWQLNHCSMEFLHQKATCELVQHSLIDKRNHASAYALLVHIAEKTLFGVVKFHHYQGRSGVM